MVVGLFQSSSSSSLVISLFSNTIVLSLNWNETISMKSSVGVKVNEVRVGRREREKMGLFGWKELTLSHSFCISFSIYNSLITFNIIIIFCIYRKLNRTSKLYNNKICIPNFMNEKDSTSKENKKKKWAHSSIQYLIFLWLNCIESIK